MARQKGVQSSIARGVLVVKVEFELPMSVLVLGQREGELGFGRSAGGGVSFMNIMSSGLGDLCQDYCLVTSLKTPFR